VAALSIQPCAAKMRHEQPSSVPHARAASCSSGARERMRGFGAAEAGGKEGRMEGDEEEVVEAMMDTQRPAWREG
jgi:hypothetical protein